MPRKNELSNQSQPKRTRKKIKASPSTPPVLEDYHSTPIPTVTEVHAHRFQWSPLKSFIIGFGCGMALLSFLVVLALLSAPRAASSLLRPVPSPGLVR